MQSMPVVQTNCMLHPYDYLKLQPAALAFALAITLCVCSHRSIVSLLSVQEGNRIVRDYEEVESVDYISSMHRTLTSNGNIDLAILLAFAVLHPWKSQDICSKRATAFAKVIAIARARMSLFGILELLDSS